jgi:hypothetical protein
MGAEVSVLPNLLSQRMKGFSKDIALHCMVDRIDEFVLCASLIMKAALQHTATHNKRGLETTCSQAQPCFTKILPYFFRDLSGCIELVCDKRVNFLNVTRVGDLGKHEPLARGVLASEEVP